MANTSGLKQYAERIASLIDSSEINSLDELQGIKLELAGEFSIKELPTNVDIFMLIDKPSAKARKLLTKKRTRSISGIVPVAIMVKPHKCPGKCIYCPSSMVEQETPKSYTGREPATMRALQNNFDAYKQAKTRLEQLEITGHSTEKIQLIVMGGTFLSMPKQYQTAFIRNALNAITGKDCRKFEAAKRAAETSKRRVIGITYETRPDFCKEKHVNRMLDLAGTHCELGVQILNDKIYKKVNRGHAVQDVINATRNLKDSGFKATYHCMPGLPFTNTDDDINSFDEMFSSQDFKPDMLKIYPCLVIKNSKIYCMYRAGKYSPLNTGEAAELIAKVKSKLPTYVRIMRIQRDIPSQLIVAGVKAGNLRQIVQQKLREKNLKCNCIRCREVGLKTVNECFDAIDADEFRKTKPGLLRQDYEASKGTEVFLSYETGGALFGFCRLRIPENSFRKEIKDKAAIIRELRVFGKALPLGFYEDEAIQHKGFGQALVKEAERISLEEFDRKKMVVISGLGVKQYYSKYLKYRREGPYMAKTLF